MTKVVNLLDTMKYSSNSESESADETETSEENNSSGTQNSDGDESVIELIGYDSDREDRFQERPPTNECLQQSARQIQRRFVDDGNHLQIFLRGDSKTQVLLRVEVFRLL